MYMDPLFFVFVPGAAAMIAAMVVPVAFGARALYRWRGKSRNRRGSCSRCGRRWAEEDNDLDLFFVEGLFVCPRCATTLRRRLWVLLPGTAMLGIVAVIGAAAGAVFGGPGLEWWLGWRLLPLLLPAVGLAGGLVGGVALMKRANRQIGGSKTEPVSLTAGDHQPEQLGPGA